MRFVTLVAFLVVAFAALVSAAPSDQVKVHKIQKLQRMDIPKLKSALLLALQKSDPEVLAKFGFDFNKIFEGFCKFLECIEHQLDCLFQLFCEYEQCINGLEHFIEKYECLVDLIKQMCDICEGGLNLLNIWSLIGCCTETWSVCCECVGVVRECFELLHELECEELEKIIHEIICCCEEFFKGCLGMFLSFPIKTSPSAFTIDSTCSSRAVEGLLALFVKHPEQWALVAKDLEETKNVIRLTDTIALKAIPKNVGDKGAVLSKAFQVTKQRAERSVDLAAILGAGVGIEAAAFEAVRQQVRMCVA